MATASRRREDEQATKMAIVDADGHVFEPIIWASDYAHPDAKLPGLVREVRENVAKLPEAAQRQILGENAIRLYHLPVGG